MSQTSTLSTAIFPCDQAVYTSARDVGGQGYRIVAAGPSLTTHEKQEITRYAPSHGGLCADASDGFAFFPLSSGRLCLMYSRIGEDEHTGRGGKNLISHILVASPNDFIAVANHPLRVANPLLDGNLVSEAPNIKPGTILTPWQAALLDRVHACPRPEATKEKANSWATLLAGLIQGESYLVVTQEGPIALLGLVLDSIPAPMRPAISLSWNLQFSSSRSLRLIVVPSADSRTKALARGRRLKLLCLEEETSGGCATEAPWLDWVSRRWNANDWLRLMAITDHPFEPCDAETMDDAARFLLAMDQLDACGPEAWVDVARRVHDPAPMTPFAEELKGQLMDRIAQRLARLATQSTGDHPPAWLARLRTALQSNEVPSGPLSAVVQAAMATP